MRNMLVVSVLVSSMLGVALSVPAEARANVQSVQVTKPVDKSSPMLRSGNDSKGGRYVGTTSGPLKKLPGKRTPPTVMLKRGMTKNIE